jgi:hypothetical protein
MTRQVRSGSGLHKATAAVTTQHSLLTSSWTADVRALETAIGRFTAARPFAGNCQVVLFEIAGDDQLHVNVIHERSRAAVRGWSGPGVLPDGCVYNRRFGDATQAQIIRHIRDMVFA